MTRVRRNGKIMEREAREFTTSVHRFLQFLADSGFDCSPRPLGIEGDVEFLEYIDGEVGNYPLTEEVKSTGALLSAARTLRQMHDIAATFEPRPHDRWMLPPREPAETMCHGDFAPYNCVFEDGRVVGVIDFDTVHPGPCAWDIAYALYRFAPFTGASNAEGFGSLEDQCERARMFCDEYGMAVEDRERLPELVVARLETLVRYMVEQAGTGDATFSDNIADGHAALYLRDIAHVRENADLIRERLVHAVRR